MFKRLLALLTALALLSALLCGCGSNNDQNSGTDEQPTEAAADSAEDSGNADGTAADSEDAQAPAAPEVPEVELTDEIRSDPVAYVTDGAMHKDDTVMTVDGTEIKADVFFYMLSYQFYQASSMYSNYGMSLNVNEAADENGTTIANYMMDLARQDCQRHVILTNHAAELGVSLDQESQSQLEQLESYLTDTVALFYASTLDAIRNANHASLLASAINDYYYGDNGIEAATDATLNDYANENGNYTCRYILLRTNDLDADDTQGKADQQAKAQELYDQMKDLEGQALLDKFCELQTEYNADGNTEPFSFDASSSLVDGFREKVAELKPGELGLTDETGYGYFVILRLEPDLTQVRSAWQSERYSALMDQWISQSTISSTQALDGLDAAQCLGRMQGLQNAVMAELQADAAAQEEETAIEENEAVNEEAETGESVPTEETTEAP